MVQGLGTPEPKGYHCPNRRLQNPLLSVERAAREPRLVVEGFWGLGFRALGLWALVQGYGLNLGFGGSEVWSL